MNRQTRRARRHVVAHVIQMNPNLKSTALRLAPFPERRHSIAFGLMPSIDLSMPKEIHPIAFELFSAYSEAGQRFEPKALKAASARLLGISTDLQTLWGAVASLGALALTIEADGDETGAEALKALVAKQAPHFRPIMEELESESGEGPARAAATFRQMFGGDTARSAPRHDEKPPEGSVSLQSLIPSPVSPRPPGEEPPRSNPSPAPRRAPRPEGRLRRGRIDLEGPSGPGPRGPRGPRGRGR